jgi:nicotinamidase-related amidase
MLKIRGFTIPRTLEEVVSPDNTALLIYDMQAGITRQIANADEIVARVRLILESARRVGMRTFFTRHMSLPKNLMGGLSTSYCLGVATYELSGRDQAHVFA